MVNTIYYPPITPYVLPEEPFDRLIATYGIRLAWMKSHSCPCEYGGPIPGSPDPKCKTCQGRGIYWDNPSKLFYGLITWVHIARTPDEPGFFTHEKVGVIQRGEPTLTIPFKADTDGTLWREASVFDAYVEVDSTARYNANLSVGGVTTVPYNQGLVIDPNDAVTIYDPVNQQAERVTGYTIQGANVFLPASYPENTGYNVEFIAQPVYIAFDRTGAPHVRPFGVGTVPETNNLPRRFRLQTLDLWTRVREYPGSASPQSLGTY